MVHVTMCAHPLLFPGLICIRSVVGEASAGVRSQGSGPFLAAAHRGSPNHLSFLWASFCPLQSRLVGMQREAGEPGTPRETPHPLCRPCLWGCRGKLGSQAHPGRLPPSSLQFLPPRMQREAGEPGAPRETPHPLCRPRLRGRLARSLTAPLWVSLFICRDTCRPRSSRKCLG